MLNVAISVDSPTDYGPHADRVVAAACEEVIGEQRCPVAGELEPGTVAAWYAVVHPSDRGLGSVRIEFRDRTADGVLIEERSLTFGAHDSLKSRLASAGSVIAALAAAREGSLARPPRREVALPPPVPLVPMLPVAAPRPDWSVQIAALAAPTFGDGPYRVGGLGSAHVAFSERGFSLVSARVAGHPGNPSFSWWTLSAGVGTRIGERSAPFNLELSSELVLEYTHLTARRDAAHASAGQTGWGGRVGVAAVWGAWQRAALVFGVDGTLVVPRINVVVGKEEAASVPLTSLGIFLGVRFLP